MSSESVATAGGPSRATASSVPSASTPKQQENNRTGNVAEHVYTHTRVVDVPGRSYRVGACNVACSRWCFAVAAALCASLCAGSLFGWANMAPILVSEGFFSEGCDTTSTDACQSQTMGINAVFTVAAITSFVSPLFVGAIAEWKGARVASVITAIIFACGAVAGVILGMDKSTILLYFTFMCFGAAASAMLLPLYQVSNMFPGHEGLALGLLGGSFDAGSMVYLVMATAYRAGFTFKDIMLVYTCGPVLLVLFFAAVLWRKEPFAPVERPRRTSTTGVELMHVHEIHVEEAHNHADASSATTGGAAHESKEEVEVHTQVAAALQSHTSPHTAHETSHAAVMNDDRHAHDLHHYHHHGSSLLAGHNITNNNKPSVHSPGHKAHLHTELHTLPVLQQLMTREWLLYAVFFSVNMLRYNAYVGTIDAQLNSLGQADSQYTRIFGIISPFGLFVQLAVGPILDHYGLPTSMSVQWALGVLLSAATAIPSLEVQIAGFLLLIAFRAFHFSNMSAYMARTFGFHTIGVTVGMVTLLGGLCSLLQTVLLKWAYDPSMGGQEKNGSFMWPNVLLLALEAVTLFFPVWLWRRQAYNRLHDDL